MSEKLSCKDPVIGPGQCPPDGCPPPDRIECIAVDKIYDSCFQVDNREREFTVDFSGLEGGDVVNCQLTPGASIACTEISRVDVGGGFSAINLLITVPITVTNPNDATETQDVTFTFTKAVTLCAPEEAQIDCSESTVLSCVCVVSDAEEDEADITCNIQLCIVVKAILRVQLLVPSYGFCTPAPCVTLPGVCPPTPPAQCF
ncbi:MAG: hypothetical protein GX262_08380 [Clostridia bacterium]|jgi:hypothetical protein|nr:hypothetical protein [Clostridia bacterium]